jgi:hypothetical protein
MQPDSAERKRKARRGFYQRNRAAEIARVRAYTETLRGRTRRLLNSARATARELGLPFSITTEHLEPLLAAAVQAGSCTLQTGCANTASIDRLVPALGYVEGNVQIIPWWLNVAYNKFEKAVVNRELMRVADELRRVAVETGRLPG